MQFSYNWLQSFFEKKLPSPEKLAEFLNMHAFEVEETSRDVEGVKKGAGDYFLEIDVLSNRGHDCLCHLGMAREIGAILNRRFDIPKVRTLIAKKGKLRPIKLKINCPALVPRYTAIVVEGVKIQKSPQWLKKRLDSAGIRSLNNIVDLTNFLMLEIGQPLHAFDYDKIYGPDMLLRQAKEGENVITLDGKTRPLPKDSLVIEDGGKRIIDLAGIMGGKLSEIDAKTKNIVFQAANFDRRSIYHTAKKMRHSTLASKIYGHGIDPNLTIFTLERVNFLLKEIGGGKIVQIVDVYPKKVLLNKIRLELDYVERLLGLKIPPAEIKSILSRLGFKAGNWGAGVVNVTIPTHRLDISIPEDLIEEIGRIYGYQKIKPAFPLAALIPPKKNFELFWEGLAKDVLKEAGFAEIYNYSFISEEDKKIFKARNAIEVKNPISAEQKYMRPSLIPNLLRDAGKNQKIFQEIKIFELGKIFVKQQKTAEEKRALTGVITGDAFYQAKGVIDLLLNKLGISDVWYDEYQPTPEESELSVWRKLRCAEIKIGQEEVGFLGEISPRILETMAIENVAVVFDVDFEKLQQLASEEHEYQPISAHPSAVRDIAVLVPREVKVEDVLNLIEAAGGKLVRDIDLFDIYEGEELPEGKKNLAFHIIYQSEDKALTSEEIDEIQNKIISALEEEPEWEVRK